MSINRNLLTAGGLIAAVVLFFAVNIIANGQFGWARFDLTENRLYTLSQGTRNVIAAIEEPVTLRLFFSDKLGTKVPQMRIYGNRVRDLLAEYVNLSDGKIRLETIDPEPFSVAEDRAVGYGLQGVPINTAGDLFYFGLVGSNTTDDSQVIAFFQAEKEQFLEYDLTKLVYGLSNPKKPLVGLITSLPLEFGPGGLQMAMRGQSQPYGIMTAMRQFFDVRTLKADTTEIDPDIDVLLLIHARDLGEPTLYAIDQFVLRGGRAMVFVDPYSETAARIPPRPGTRPDPLNPQGSNLDKLFAAWGVAMDATKMVGDRGFATRVNTGRTGRRQIVAYVAWLGLQGDAFDRADVITAELNQMTVASPGHLLATEDATTELTALIRSSADSMLIAVSKARRPDPEALLSEFVADEARYVIATRVTGPVKSAFDGPPAAPTDDKAESKDETAGEATAEPKPHLAESTAPVNLIVVADADLIDDRFWLSRQKLFGRDLTVPISANANFLVNGLDNLAGSNDLISLRSRARSDRPFLVVEEIRRQAERQFLASEKELQDKLIETEKQIAELQSKAKAAGGQILPEEESRAIARFRDELLDTRLKLRAVQHDLRKDIESLEAKLMFANIGLVPLVVFVVALVLALIRHRRRKASAAIKQA